MVLLWWCHSQRDIKEGVTRMAMDKGQRACVSSGLIGGFTAIWKSSCEGADWFQMGMRFSKLTDLKERRDFWGS